jgi:hypothetical protein
MTLADGRWAVFGGNQPVTYGGAAVKDQPGKANPYGNTEGGDAIRVLTPCDDGNCAYAEGGAQYTMTVSFTGICLRNDMMRGETRPSGEMSLSVGCAALDGWKMDREQRFRCQCL